MDEIYALAAEELRKADSPATRRKAFRHALLRAYEGGIDAQREILQSYPHDRPTPVPPPHAAGTTDASGEPDPGVLPPAPPAPGPPAGAFSTRRK